MISKNVLQPWINLVYHEGANFVSGDRFQGIGYQGPDALEFPHKISVDGWVQIRLT